MSHPSDAAGRAAPAVWLVLTCLAITYVVWGTTYFAIKVGLEEAGPFYMLGTRFVVAGALLFVGLVHRRTAPADRAPMAEFGDSSAS